VRECGAMPPASAIPRNVKVNISTECQEKNNADRTIELALRL
jgi:hypothetical protein